MRGTGIPDVLNRWRRCFNPFGEGESLTIRGRNVMFNLNEKIIILDQLSDVVY